MNPTPSCFHWITVPIALRSLERCVLGQKALANVPADARLVSCWRDVLGRPRREMLLLKFEHPSFRPVPDGGRVPLVKPVWSAQNV